ncbi:DegT/DnrJ/EryC1/StrS family aminotransferase [Candidatus Woesearchaeota archaeon]|nr:DegT/DnrJ/EryC1/StrS family aminotransferase [Candidatus Woesearchaeota archaeon]
MVIPFLDLQAQLKPINKDIMVAVKDVIDSGNFIMGNQINLFESEIASYLGVKHAISCASGSDALLLSLMSIGVKPGDEIITSPFTFFATAGAISRLGAKPVFVDIDKHTFNIDPSLIEEKITSKTKAILPVHIFGQPADMDAIISIANRRGLKVIEDACQAIGSEYGGLKAGTIGDLGCFSFFPTKNLGAFGDGGLIVTNDDNLASYLKKARLHGSSKKYHHDFVGFNSRLDALQASVLRIKLPYLDVWNNQRRYVAEKYSSHLQNHFITPFVASNVVPVFHQYALLAKSEEERDSVLDYLNSQKISSGVYYPIPLHLQDCFADLGYLKGDLPIAEDVCKRIFSIPIYPEVDYKTVLDSLDSFYPS